MMIYSVKPCIKNGRSMFRLDIRKGSWGPRQRKFFGGESDAKSAGEAFVNHVGLHGSAVAPVGVEEIHALARWLKTFSLFELEEIFRRVEASRGSGDVTVTEGVAVYIEVCRKRGGQALHLSDLKSRLETKFCERFGAMRVRDVRTGMIDDWLDGLDVGLITRNNYLKAERGFFGYAVIHEWAEADPTARIQKIAVAGEEVTTLATSDMLDLLVFGDTLTRSWRLWGWRPDVVRRSAAVVGHAVHAIGRKPALLRQPLFSTVRRKCQALAFPQPSPGNLR